MTTSLCRLQIQGEIVEGDRVELIGRCVEVVIAAEAVPSAIEGPTTPALATTLVQALVHNQLHL